MIQIDPGSLIFGLLCGGFFGTLVTCILAGQKMQEIHLARMCAKCRHHIARFCPDCVTEAIAKAPVPLRDRSGKFVKRVGTN